MLVRVAFVQVYLECINNVLQVSSAITVAYISSIAFLVLASLQPASHEKIGDNATYFDSVIFLTTFILAGQHSITPGDLRSSLTNY